MSLQYLKDAVKHGETEKLIRYVRLHVRDGDEHQGRKEIDKAWIEALKPLLDVSPTDRERTGWTKRTRKRALMGSSNRRC